MEVILIVLGLCIACVILGLIGKILSIVATILGFIIDWIFDGCGCLIGGIMILIFLACII